MSQEHNQITLFATFDGTLGTLSLDVPFKIDPRFAASNSTDEDEPGSQIAPGTYTFTGIAYVPSSKPELQARYGRAIIRFNDANGFNVAIIGGASDNEGFPVLAEGESIRVSNETLEEIIAYLDGKTGTELVVTEEEPGVLTSLVGHNWIGREVTNIRPRRIKATAIGETELTDDFYTSSTFGDLELDIDPFWEFAYLFITDPTVDVEEVQFAEDAEDQGSWVIETNQESGSISDGTGFSGCDTPTLIKEAAPSPAAFEVHDYRRFSNTENNESAEPEAPRFSFTEEPDRSFEPAHVQHYEPTPEPVRHFEPASEPTPVHHYTPEPVHHAPAQESGGGGGWSGGGGSDLGNSGKSDSGGGGGSYSGE